MFRLTCRGYCAALVEVCDLGLLRMSTLALRTCETVGCLLKFKSECLCGETSPIDQNLSKNPNKSHFCHQEPISHCLHARLSQNNDNSNTMELKSILSLQVLNIHDEEPVSIKTMAEFFAILLDVEAMEVDIPHSFLDACCAT